MNLTAQEANEQGFYFLINGRNCKITRYKGTATDVVIPTYINGKPVRKIGTRAFAHKNIHSVVLPETLRIIQTEAFADNLISTITLPASICKVEDRAFLYCTKLEQVTTLKASNMDITHHAFEKTSYITSKNFVILGEMLLKINLGNYASNSTLTIPDGVKEIKSEAYNTSAYYETIHIPASVRTIDEKAFGRMHMLTNVVIERANPYSFLRVERGAFGSFENYYSPNPFLWSYRKALIEGDPYQNSGWITFRQLYYLNTRQWSAIHGKCEIYVPHSKAAEFWRILDLVCAFDRFEFRLKLDDYEALFEQVDKLYDQLEMAKCLGQLSSYHRDKTYSFLAKHIYKAVAYAVKDNHKQRLMEYRAMQLLSPERGFRYKKVAHLTDKYTNEAAQYLKELIRTES